MKVVARVPSKRCISTHFAGHFMLLHEHILKRGYCPLVGTGGAVRTTYVREKFPFQHRPVWTFKGVI